MTYSLRFLSLITLISVSACDVMENRVLKAPLLEKDNVLHKILCHRPVRSTGEPCIQVREGRLGEQTIIDNYGHGSAGYGLAWQSAYKAVGLVEEDFNVEPVIVGGGIIGLTTAYQLLRAGYRPRAIIAREFGDLTSHNAGGMLAYESSNPDPALRARVNKLFTESHRVWRDIADGHHAHINHCARSLPAYFPRRAASDLEASVEAGVVSRSQDVVVKFDTPHHEPRRMVVYDDAIFVDVQRTMRTLYNYLTLQGVRFIQEDVASLHEIDSNLVFNCTGLGARELADDAAMHPVQGHLLALKGQTPGALDYMVEEVVSRKITSGNKPITEMVYSFPKPFEGQVPGSTAVLGGTSIANADGTTPHEEEFALLRLRARKYFGYDKE